MSRQQRTNSRLADFKIVEIFHKAYKHYFSKPSGSSFKNHYYWKEKKFFDLFLEKSKKDPNKLRLKKNYRDAIDALIKDFNQYCKGYCQLTKHNVFAFLLIFAEACAENNHVGHANPGWQAYLENETDETDPEMHDILHECMQETAQSLFFCHMCEKYYAIQWQNFFSEWKIDKQLRLLHILLFLKRVEFDNLTADYMQKFL